MFSNNISSGKTVFRQNVDLNRLNNNIIERLETHITIEGTPGHQNPRSGFQTPNPLLPFGEF
jgi:hypothetical protein